MIPGRNASLFLLFYCDFVFFCAGWHGNAGWERGRIVMFAAGLGIEMPQGMIDSSGKGW